MMSMRTCSLCLWNSDWEWMGGEEVSIGYRDTCALLSFDEQYTDNGNLKGHDIGYHNFIFLA